MSFSCVGEFPKDRALCMALREVLNLPTREIFRNIGPDSLLILLDQLNSSACEQSIFMFWRAMHLRNDLIFGQERESISSSVNFVQNYWSSFSPCHAKVQVEVTNKGKEVGDDILAFNNMERISAGWQLPITEFFKINGCKFCGGNQCRECGAGCQKPFWRSYHFLLGLYWSLL